MAENEIKFVARHDHDFKDVLMRLYPNSSITQGYLNTNARLRKAQSAMLNGVRYYFTYKQRLANGENFEVEPEISAEQFKEVWDQTEHRLTKDRVTVMYDGIQWDIDFYGWSYPYFILIEAEMPSGMARPATIPALLKDHIFYEVPREDDRFTARRLSDENHVMRLAVELGLLYL